MATNQFSNLPKDCIQACSNFILGSGVDFPRYLDTKLRYDMNLLEQVYNNVSRFNTLFNHHFLLWGQVTSNFFFIDKINPDYTGNDIHSIIQMDQDHTVRFKKLSSVNRFNSGHYFIDVFCLNEFTKIKEIITLSALNLDSLNYKMNYYMLNKVKENDLLIFKGLMRTNFVKNGGYVFRIVKNTRLFHDSQL